MWVLILPLVQLSADSSIRNDIILAVSFQSATVVLTALAKVMTSAFMQLPLEGMDNRCAVVCLPDCRFSPFTPWIS